LRALIGEQRVAADDKALSGDSRPALISARPLVERGKLNGPGLGQAADRRRPQGGDEVETGRFDGLLDARLGDQAAIADQHHMLEGEPLLDLVNLVLHR
jgi:hypothetical protein